MTEWALKRFWDAATVSAAGTAWAIRLDDRPVKTPAKAPLEVPTQALAEAIAAEWEAQTDQINPNIMPMTRLANSAIDKVAPQRAEVIALLAAYGDNDLICYRADGPAGLITAQRQAWDPLVAWASETFGARLTLVEGVMPRPQPVATLACLAAPLDGATAPEIAALYDLISLSGSLVIGLACARDYAPPETLWDASQVDEAWQVLQWGEDVEAAETTALRRGAFLDAARFCRLCKDLG
ncbi:MAG: ATP12 family protein [Pseudomonadota bacterium]